MFEAILTRISSQLDDGAVPYMVIGGQTVLLYGEPRLTKDIDVTRGATLERLPEILPLVEAMGLKALFDPEQFTRQTMVLPCRDPDSDLRVDFIFSFSAYGALASERARSVELADAIIHKVIAGRPRPPYIPLRLLVYGFVYTGKDCEKL